MDSKILKSEDFGLKIYNRFPPAYREDDIRENFALKRYLQVLGDGGFKYAIDDINGLTDIINPKTAKAEALPYLAEQYGLEVFHGIPDEYLRFLIPMLNDAWNKKGSIEVLESIVQVMSGVKTISEVFYDDTGNPYVNIKLEMDYNYGNYFPDPEQFNKLLDKFLPFYVDKTLIYDYMFYTSCNIRGSDDPFMDRVKETTEEQIYIPNAKGWLPVRLTNSKDKLLNNGFILNDQWYSEVDPDYFWDTLIQSFADVAKIKTDTNAEDKVVRVPVVDSAVFKTTETKFDVLKIEDEWRYYSTLNTNLVLNKDFMTNEDKAERGIVFTSDDLVEKVQKVDSETKDFLDDKADDRIKGLFTNTSFSVTNTSVAHAPDCFDIVSFRGSDKVIYPTFQGVIGL